MESIQQPPGASWTLQDLQKPPKNPQDIEYHLDKAYFISTDGRPGPVWIDIPADIQNAKINVKNLKKFKPKLKKTNFKNIDFKIKKIAKLLSTHDKPLIHIGQGVKISGGEVYLRKLQLLL